MSDGHDAGPLTRERAAAILRGIDPEAMADALVAIALNEPDGRWVLAECDRLSTHADANLRRLSAVCLGHLARIHGEIDRPAAESMLRRLAADPDAEVRAAVEDAPATSVSSSAGSRTSRVEQSDARG